MNRTRAAGLVLLGASLFATAGLAKAVGPDVHDVQLAALRLLLATGLFAVLAGGLRVELLGSRPIWAAGVAQAIFQIAIFTAFSRVGLAVGTLVGIGLSPLVTGLLSRTWTPRWAASTAVGIAGLALLVGTGGPVDAVGLVAAVTAATALAAYIVAIGRPVGLDASVGERLTAIFGIGAALLLVPAVLVGQAPWVDLPSAWALAAFLAVVPTVLAYGSYNAGRAHLPAGSTATFGLMEPVVAAVLGVLILGEAMGPAGVLGAVLIVVAVLVLVAGDRSTATTREDV